MKKMSGIGVDIVQIPRIEKLLEKYGDVFSARVLGVNELAIFKRISICKRASFLAKRFAAKEAVSKALGTGIGDIHSFQDIEIVNLENGRPVVQIKDSDIEVLISITDDYPVAVAFATYCSSFKNCS